MCEQTIPEWIDPNDYYHLYEDDGFTEVDSYCEAMQDPASEENTISNELAHELSSIKMTKTQREFQDYLDSL